MITTVCKISYGSQTVPPIVPAVQGDTGRAISFEIADFTPPAGATATYFILKPSGEAIYNSATITDNSILCELTAQSLAEAGENRMQVRVLLGDDIVTSFEVILMVRTFLGDDAIESGTEMNIFDQAVEQATEQFQENAEQIVEEVIESIPADYTELTEEVSELNERLTVSSSDLLDNEFFMITNHGECFNSSGSGYTVIDINSPTTNPQWNSYLIPCSANDVFTVFTVGGLTTYAWAFIDASGNILSKSSSNATVDGATITAPSNTEYLVVNDKGGNSRVYANQLYKKIIDDKLKLKKDNCTFYIGNGGSASWSTYDETPVTLNLGSDDYIIIIDNEQYTVAVSDILTIATNAGMTVDQSNKTITYASFVLYFDLATHSPKIVLGITTANGKKAITENPVLFVGHYKSIRAGFLIDYMQERRIETAEEDINNLDMNVNAILAVSEDIVPSYFESNLSTKIPEIIANMNDTGKNGTSFVFITDLHWETNYKNSPSLVKRVLDKTSVKNVFCGGDIINQGEKPAMSETFLDCIDHFRFIPNNGFFPIARGNHDDNSNWSSAQDVETYAFDNNTIYNLLFSQIAELVTPIGSNFAFYFDQTAIKTRYIFVDTKRNGLIIDYSAIINCMGSVQSGWHIIFIMHFTLNNATTLFAGCDLLAHIVKAYNDRESGSYTGSYQTATYDFTNASGTVDLIIGGHMHADYAMDADDINNPSGIPIIATDTDSYRNSSATEGTVDSQCFDVVTVDYTARTVKCVRIGRGTDRTFTY